MAPQYILRVSGVPIKTERYPTSVASCGIVCTLAGIYIFDIFVPKKAPTPKYSKLSDKMNALKRNFMKEAKP